MKKKTLRETKFIAPSNLSEALQTLAQLKHEDVRIVAGGTDVVPSLNSRNEWSSPDLFYIGDMKLNYIKEGDGKIRIGSTTTFTEILESEIVSNQLPLLRTSVKQLGNISVRNSATIGGNIMNASPAADSVLPLIVYDAELILKSSTGERNIPIDQFFKGPGETDSKNDELLTEISIPVPEGSGSFSKIGRRKAQSLSVVNTCCRAVEDGQLCKDIRIAIGAVAPTPLRCKKAEGVLMNNTISLELINKAVDSVLQDITPIDNTRASAWYRQKLAGILIKRTLCDVFKIENGGEKV